MWGYGILGFGMGWDPPRWLVSALGSGARRTRALTAAVAAVCMLVPIAFFVPHYIEQAGVMRQEQEIASEAFHKIERSFEADGLYPIGFDPLEEHERDRYLLTAHSDEDDFAGEGSYISLEIDNSGTVVSVSYSIELDAGDSPDKSLAFAQEELARLHASVARLDVGFAAPELSEFSTLPAEFEAECLAGSLEEDVTVLVEDARDEGGAYVRCHLLSGDSDPESPIAAEIRVRLEV